MLVYDAVLLKISPIIRHHLTLAILFLIALACLWSFWKAPPAAPVIRAGEISVRQFGARGDGVTKDTAAFQRALATAGLHAPRIVDVPAGDYLLGAIVLPSHVTLQLEPGALLRASGDAADYPLTTGRWEGREVPIHQALISARQAEDIAILGPGMIRGEPQVSKLRNPRGPTLIELVSCHHIQIGGGLHIVNYNGWTVHPVYCRDVAISHVDFWTHGRTSDCLDPDSCQNVAIDQCSFTSGDDCISLKSGRGLEGQEVNVPCENISITHCRFEGGLGCIALGSELSGGIRNVSIRDCDFHGGLVAIYLKTNESRGAYVEDVTADHLRTDIPLFKVDAQYSHWPSSNDIPGPAGLTSLRRFSFTHISIHSNHWLRCFLSYFKPKLRPGDFVDVEGDPKEPFDGLLFGNISGSDDHGFIIKNVVHLQLENVHLQCAYTPMLQLTATTMVPAQSAAPNPPPNSKAATIATDPAAPSPH